MFVRQYFKYMYIASRGKNLSKCICSVRYCFEGLGKLIHSNSIIRIRPWEFACQFLLCYQPF